MTRLAPWFMSVSPNNILKLFLIFQRDVSQPPGTWRQTADDWTLYCVHLPSWNTFWPIVFHHFFALSFVFIRTFILPAIPSLCNFVFYFDYFNFLCVLPLHMWPLVSTYVLSLCGYISASCDFRCAELHLCGRDSSVGITSSYGLVGQGIETW